MRKPPDRLKTNFRRIGDGVISKKQGEQSGKVYLDGA